MPFTEPSKYAVGFHHTDWLDNVDRVQAGGANGFNHRFRSLESEFASIQNVLDSVGVVSKELQNSIEAIENRLKGTWTLENLNVPGKLGVGTTAPSAKLSVVGPGASDIGGSVLSDTFVTSAGTLGIAPNSDLALASIGFNASGNNASLGIRARRIANGGGWGTASVGLTLDVDNTVEAGAAIWLRHNRYVGIGTPVPEDRLDVAGALRVLSDSNPLRFTAGWSGHADASKAEIANDTNGYKSLMIVGNSSSGHRKVSIYDRLDINGPLKLELGGYVNEFSTDTTLSGNSDAAVPTERAVKTYVDKYPIIQNGRTGTSRRLGHRDRPGASEDIEETYIQFDRPFGGTPQIVLGTVRLDVYEGKNARYDTWVESVTNQGFLLKFRAWSDTELYNLVVDWLAYGPA